MTETPGSLRDDESLRPVVGIRRREGGAAVAAALIVATGVGLFAWMNLRRSETAPPPLTAPVSGSRAAPEASIPPLVLPLPAAEPEPAAPDVERRAVAPVRQFAPVPPPSLEEPRPQPPPAADHLGRPRGAASQLLIVDLTPARPAAGRAAGGGETAVPGASGAAAAERGSQDLLGQLGGSEDRVEATRLRRPAEVVPQGALIPAVLETAIDSDLPGMARAVISRDVLAFDGRTVLIPRGSRLIGQYRSDVRPGQSRVFVVWSRVLRPDGASVQLSSPAADDLGRGGLGGKVDRHFLGRFGGPMLLSVLSAGMSALADRAGPQIYVASPVSAAGAQAQETQLAPTIRVKQGVAIRVFVARDLDFAAVGPAQ